ncbi:MAG: TonB-dependent receptor [Flavobacteriales bacterium]|nr:TonB-dependent receptor [Flavobacteriales bacterium]
MRYFFLFFFCFFSLILYAQNITFLDSKTRKPLELINITGLPSNQTVSTNHKGIANISSLKNEEKIFVSLLGYKTQEFSYAELKEKLEHILMFSSYFNIGEIVISATKWEQKSQAVPHKITSIDRKSFQFQNPQTTADLLNTSGEVFIQKSQQGGGSPMIRGFATNRLLYAVDGVRMNTAIFRSGNIQNVISLDPFTMEKVEVLFGPGAITYGSDAIGGVMNFNTLKPKLSLSDTSLIDGNLALRTSTANSEISTHLDFSIATRKWGFLSSFSRTDYGDLKMGKNGPTDYLRDSLVIRQEEKDLVVKNSNNKIQAPTNYSQTNLMQKILFQPNKKLSLSYAFHFSETTEFDRYDRLIEKRDGVFRFAEWKYGPQKWQMHHLEATLSKETTFYDKLKINLAYQHFQESRIDRALNSNEKETKTEKVNAYSFNLDFFKTLGASHQLFYGFENILNQVDSRAKVNKLLTLTETVSQSRYPKSDWYSNAIYLTDHISLGPKLSIEAGLRVNHFGLNSVFDTSFVQLPFEKIKLNKVAVNASLGAVYRPSESWVFSSNLSTGFRAPNVDDIGKFDNQRDFSVLIPNEELTAEYAYNIDFGATHILNDAIKVDFTVFYTLLENALVRRGFQLDAKDSLDFNGKTLRIEAIQNAAQASVYGLQAGIEARINDNFNFSGDVNFQKGEEELEDGSKSSSRHAAPLFAIGRLNFTKGKIKLQLNLQYSDKVSFSELNVEEREKIFIYASDKNNMPYSPSWYTLNFKSQFSFNKSINVNFGVENITNQRYKTYSSGIAAAGINFVFSLTANF